MKKYLICFLLASCAPPIINQHIEVESEFQYYIDSFESYSGVKYEGSAIFVEQNVLSFYKKDAIGVCIKHNTGNKEIKIDKEYWFLISNEAKEQLIFHELGHCALNRPHQEEILSVLLDDEIYNYPQSIMYPSNFGGVLYGLLRDYYIKELINPEESLTEISL